MNIPLSATIHFSHRSNIWLSLSLSLPSFPFLTVLRLPFHRFRSLSLSRESSILLETRNSTWKTEENLRFLCSRPIQILFFTYIILKNRLRSVLMLRMCACMQRCCVQVYFITWNFSSASYITAPMCCESFHNLSIQVTIFDFACTSVSLRWVCTRQFQA